MHNYFRHLSLWLKRFVWLLLLYTGSRLFFLLLNTEYFSQVSFTELVKAFAAGIRFDIASIVFTNVIFILLLLPGEFKNRANTQKTGSVLFFVINALAIMSNLADARFFDFINKRSTSAIFTLMGTNRDVWMMIPRFLRDYWYVAVTWIGLMVIFWRWMPRLTINKLISEKITCKTGVQQSLIFMVVLGFMFWGARGTKLKPITIIDAAVYADFNTVPLVLNTPFTIIKTIENENLITYKYFPEDSLIRYYNPVHNYAGKHAFRKMNVVIIILESFSSEYSGFLSGDKGYTPHLDSVLRESLVIKQAFANGTQSYEALPAIIAGMPSLMDRPYSGSNYADNAIESLPFILGQEGYHTSFFHGGNNGTMGFSNFTRMAGVDLYYGRDEYNNNDDFDGHWGIWDEPFLQNFALQLNRYPQPFFTAVFTLSSHHPYNVPISYKDKFNEGSLPILKSIRYTDYALGRFFTSARRMPWFNNTLFVITADHAAQAIERVYNTSTGMFSIPLAFYCPSDSTLKGPGEVTGQQTDILPTVLDYLGYPKPFFGFGESLLDTNAPHSAISFTNGIYQLVEGEYVMQFDGEKVIAFFYTEHDENQNYESIDEIPDPAKRKIFSNMEVTLKAIIQTYNHCLINNSASLRQNQ